MDPARQDADDAVGVDVALRADGMVAIARAVRVENLCHAKGDLKEAGEHAQGRQLADVRHAQDLAVQAHPVVAGGPKLHLGHVSEGLAVVDGGERSGNGRAGADLLHDGVCDALGKGHQGADDAVMGVEPAISVDTDDAIGVALLEIDVAIEGVDSDALAGQGLLPANSGGIPSRQGLRRSVELEEDSLPDLVRVASKVDVVVVGTSELNSKASLLLALGGVLDLVEGEKHQHVGVEVVENTHHLDYFSA